MRCIEILDILLAVNVIRRLTLTWDVLKWLKENLVLMLYVININMRCIEITETVVSLYFLDWLTLTWDVLKLAYSIQVDIKKQD